MTVENFRKILEDYKTQNNQEAIKIIENALNTNLEIHPDSQEIISRKRVFDEVFGNPEKPKKKKKSTKNKKAE